MISINNGIGLDGSGAPCVTGATLSNLLLDSSHILTANNLKMYDIKLIDCGKYKQVYIYKNNKSKSSKKDDDKKKSIRNIDTDNLMKKELDDNSKTIEKRSIIRSKLECQRLAKANSDVWETFITLTFEENIIDLEYANKKFRNFVDSIKRINKDFKYICIPEFQKRGAVHYHLLTNISIDDSRFIYSQEDNIKFKHVKYWSYGFTKVDNLQGDIKKIIGYISKYMTKDIDNRLFNRHRYYFSRNLNRPIVNYIDSSNEKEYQFYLKQLSNKSSIYNNTYYNSYNDNPIQFIEYL